jgi:ABC-type glutathione transport system ATPase component
MQSLVEVKDLRVRYGRREVVHGVSFRIVPRQIYAVVGESGSGKSTLARAVAGLEKPSGGELTVRADSVQMIFQDAVGSLNPRMRIRTALEEALFFGRRRKDRAAATFPDAVSLLDAVGLSDAVLEQYPRELSGGQCQRVSIARALARDPRLLIADEPVSALDVSVQARILNLLRELKDRLGLSILLVAHDLAVVKNVCDRVSVMENGVFAESGPSEMVFSDPKSEYTRRLLAAVPKI